MFCDFSLVRENPSAAERCRQHDIAWRVARSPACRAATSACTPTTTTVRISRASRPPAARRRPRSDRPSTCGERSARLGRPGGPRNRSAAVAVRRPNRRPPCSSAACVCRVCSSGWPAPTWLSAATRRYRPTRCGPTTACRTRPAAPPSRSTCPSPPSGGPCPSAAEGPT